MNKSGKEPAASADDDIAGPQDGPGGAKAKDPRGERLAAALRANLGRRKAARRSGLGDFDLAEPREEET
jgi:hypothetical protein